MIFFSHFPSSFNYITSKIIDKFVYIRNSFYLLIAIPRRFVLINISVFKSILFFFKLTFKNTCFYVFEKIKKVHICMWTLLPQIYRSEFRITTLHDLRSIFFPFRAPYLFLYYYFADSKTKHNTLFDTLSFVVDLRYLVHAYKDINEENIFKRMMILLLIGICRFSLWIHVKRCIISSFCLVSKFRKYRN